MTAGTRQYTLPAAGRTAARRTPEPAVQPLRILAVTPHFLPKVGGVEMHTFETARRLVKAGHQVSVLTTQYAQDQPQRERIEGVSVIRVPSFGNRLDLRFAPEMNRVIRCGGWDILHIQSIHTLVAPLAMLAAQRAGAPYVVTFHSGGHSSGLRNAVRATQWSLVRPLAARAQKLIGVSDFEAGYFRRKFDLPDGNVITIPNGAQLPAIRAPHAAAVDPDLVVSVGRLERYKGHHRVLEALPKVLERRPGVRLRIAGSGPYEAQLRAQARELGVANAVTIEAIPTGERERMTALLASAAVVTLLSEYESHGIAALEALSLRRPVLVTKSTALAELVERGLAVGVRPESAPEEIASAILEQLARPHCPPEVELPSWDECAARLGKLYTSIVMDPACEY